MDDEIYGDHNYADENVGNDLEYTPTYVQGSVTEPAAVQQARTALGNLANIDHPEAVKNVLRAQLGKVIGDFEAEAASHMPTDITGSLDAQTLSGFAGGDTLSAIQHHREEHTSLNEGYKGMTAADLQLRRLQGDASSDMSGYSMGTRMAIKDLASDQFRGMNTYGVKSIAELDAVRSRASKALETSPHAFSQMMSVDPTQIGEVRNGRGGVIREAGRYGASEVSQAIKFMEGIGTNLDLGPGGRQTLHSGNADTDKKQTDELAWALDYTKTLADKFIHPDTKGSNIYGVRQEATQQAILDRMLDGSRFNKPLPDGKHYMHDEKKKLPSPLDLGVPGLIDNRASGGKIDGQYVTGSEFSEREHQQALIEGKHSPEYLTAAAPNPMGSLYPKPSNIEFDSPEGKEFYKQRRIDFNEEQDNYQKASAIINAQMTTNHNEVTGKRSRWSGYDMDEEQLKRNQHYEDAAMYDISVEGRKVKGASAELLAKVGKGSDRTGMHGGGEDRSDRDEYIEEMMEDKPFVGPMPIKQGSDAWLDQRKGNITASVIGKTTEELAIDLANERLGNTSQFISSGHVKEGNLYEDAVARSFDFEIGNDLGLTRKEAFFETNKDLPGFGISPDANLYDEEGNRSLLELKYLSSDASMKKSMKTYQDQLQLQMAVTGVSSAHFYRMNKRTGETMHDLVQADPEQQAALIKKGRDAQELAATLDAEGVDELMKQKLPSRKQRQANDEAGPATVISTNKKAKAAKATVMDLSTAALNPLAAAISGGAVRDSNGSSDISQEEFATRLKREDNIANLKEHTVAVAVEKTKSDAKDAKNYENLEKDRVKLEAEDRKMGLQEVAAKEEDARRTSDAAKKTAASIKELGAAAKRAASLLGTVADAVLEGNDTEMATQRIASETGMDAKRVEGMREEMRVGGVDYNVTGQIMSQAGALSKEAASELGAAELQSRLSAGITGNTALRNAVSVPHHGDIHGMSGEGWVEYAVETANTLEDPKARRDWLDLVNMGKLAPALDRDNKHRITKEDMVSARGDIKSPDRFDHNAGVETGADLVMSAKEDAASGGFDAGKNTKIAAEALPFAGSVMDTAVDVVTGIGGAYISAKVLFPKATANVMNSVKSLAKKGKALSPHIAKAGSLGSKALGIVGSVPATGLLAMTHSTGLNQGEDEDLAKAEAEELRMREKETIAETRSRLGSSPIPKSITGAARAAWISSNKHHEGTVPATGTTTTKEVWEAGQPKPDWMKDSERADKARRKRSDAKYAGVNNAPGVDVVPGVSSSGFGDESLIPSRGLGIASSSPQGSSGGLNSNVVVNVEYNKDGVTTEVDNNGDKYMDTDNTYSQD